MIYFIYIIHIISFMGTHEPSINLHPTSVASWPIGLEHRTYTVWPKFIFSVFQATAQYFIHKSPHFAMFSAWSSYILIAVWGNKLEICKGYPPLPDTTLFPFFPQHLGEKKLKSTGVYWLRHTVQGLYPFLEKNFQDFSRPQKG